MHSKRLWGCFHAVVESVNRRVECQGAGDMRGYWARPASAEDRLPVVLVIHEAGLDRRINAGSAGNRGSVGEKLL